jgi:hypothetical protein
LKFSRQSTYSVRLLITFLFYCQLSYSIDLFSILLTTFLFYWSLSYTIDNYYPKFSRQSTYSVRLLITSYSIDSFPILLITFLSIDNFPIHFFIRSSLSYSIDNFPILFTTFLFYWQLFYSIIRSSPGRMISI